MGLFFIYYIFYATKFLIQVSTKKSGKMAWFPLINPVIRKTQTKIKALPGADPNYIHLCECWSHIFSGKIFKKYRNTHFLHQIIVFFSSADRKD